MGPNTALAAEIKALLLDLLGKRPDGTTAWSAVASANALTSGEVGTAATSGLEATFSLYPDEHDPRLEFSESGVKGLLHYALVVKAASSVSTWPARERLFNAYPLLSSRAARRPRLSPETDRSYETLTVHIPQTAE